MEIDVVTMATPFNIGGQLSPLVSILASIGSFFTSLVNSSLTFQCSIGENDYGGDAPGCLCRYISFVSDPMSDESPGGGKAPDGRLRDWNPSAKYIGNIPGVGHTGVPAHVLSTEPGTLDAGCQCTT